MEHFGRVRHTTLHELLQATKSVYGKVIGRVRINGLLSEEYAMEKGLKQGDSLSPLLFILMMDRITKKCNNLCRSKKTKIGHWNLIPIYIQALHHCRKRRSATRYSKCVGRRTEGLGNGTESWKM